MVKRLSSPFHECDVVLCLCAVLLVYCVISFVSMIVIESLFPATCRRKLQRCRRRTLPSHRRIWPVPVCQWRQANFKTQTNALHFYILYITYLPFMYYYNWVGIIVVVIGEPPYNLYPSAIALIIQLLPSHVHLFVLRQCLMKRPRPTLRVRLRETGCHT